MRHLKEIKVKVMNDWKEQFNELTSYSQFKLLKTAGPLIIGIEIVNLPRSDDYRPYFTCYPLWKDMEQECIKEPLVFQEIRNKGGLQFNIPYVQHDLFFQEAVECCQEQILVPLNSVIHLSSVNRMIEYQYLDILVQSSPVAKAKFLELKLYCALYMGNTGLVSALLEEIRSSCKTWNPQLFNWKYGTCDLWIKGLEEQIKFKEAFFTKILMNLANKKISKLKHSELID